MSQNLKTYFNTNEMDVKDRTKFLKEQHAMLQRTMWSMEKFPSFCEEKSGDFIFWVTMFSVFRYGSKYFMNFVHQVLINPYDLGSMIIPIFKMRGSESKVVK